MKIFLFIAVLVFVGCNATNQHDKGEDAFKVSTLDSVNNPGEVKALNDVYKMAFQAAQATITYEIANDRLDAIDAEIQKELNEVGP